jgi:hypothetical protein
MYKYKEGKFGRPAYDPIMMLKILFDKINYYITNNKCIIHNGLVMDASIVNKKMTNSKVI